MKIIGHRGAKGLAPENTLQSFAKALEHAVDCIETDVHVTKDGVPVLTHDDTIKLNDQQQLRILDHSYAELVIYKPDLATLEEAIQFIDRQVPFYLEIKERQAPAPIIAILQDFLARGWQPNDFLLASYDFVLLSQLHLALPDIPTVIGERWSGVRATHRARKLGTRNLSMQQRWLWRGFISPMARRGWHIYAYTMNDPSKVQRFKRYGVFAIFTDYPDLFKRS